MAGATLAYGTYLITRDSRIALVLGIVPIIGAAAGALYGRRASREVVALLFGMGVGGGDWALVSLLVEAKDRYVNFLQQHAFDYFTAAALVGFSVYFLGPDPGSAHPRWKDIWVVTILTVIAATTSFSAGASPDLTVRIVFGSVVAGIVVVVAMRLLLPAVTPR